MKNSLPKLSFKKHPKNTGLYAVGNPESNVDIKVDGIECGSIMAPSWQTKDNKWEIRLMVMKENFMPSPEEPSNWKNIFFKTKFDSEKDAREWLKQNWEIIINKYTIRKAD